MSATPTAHATAPTQFSCRSQLYRLHVIAGARFEEVAGSAVVADYGDAGGEVQQARRLALTDLSTLARTGFKGGGAPDWLEAQAVRLPNIANQAVRQKDGSLVARLSNNELLVLSDLHSDATLPATLQDKWSLESTERVYRLPRRDSHCWFALSGENAATTLSKVCGVDLRAHKFAEHEIAQTSLAKVNAIILRDDLAATPCFFILSDVSCAEYLWDALLDAMAEFHGSPVGIAAFRTLQAEPGCS